MIPKLPLVILVFSSTFLSRSHADGPKINKLKQLIVSNFLTVQFIILSNTGKLYLESKLITCHPNLPLISQVKM